MYRFFSIPRENPENPAKPCGVFHDQPAQWIELPKWADIPNWGFIFHLGKIIFSHNHNGHMIEMLVEFYSNHNIITLDLFGLLYLGLTTVVPPFLDIPTSLAAIQPRTSQTQFVVLLTPPNESWKVQTDSGFAWFQPCSTYPNLRFLLYRVQGMLFNSTWMSKRWCHV